jgi:hypothetical protein
MTTTPILDRLSTGSAEQYGKGIQRLVSALVEVDPSLRKGVLALAFTIAMLHEDARPAEVLQVCRNYLERNRMGSGECPHLEGAARFIINEVH